MVEYDTSTLLLILLISLIVSLGGMELLWRRIMLK